MKRRIIVIDSEKCTGCGLCVDACHEGAIGWRDGKAALLRDDYCDGLGDCLPACPTHAISFEEREALPYDAAAVERKKQEQPSGCPGSRMRIMQTKSADATASAAASQLTTWPVQIKLVAPNAPYFSQCDLLIAADCTAYAYGGFHEKWMRGRVTLIGCPKLDDIDYSEKLAQVLSVNDIRSITVVRMEVPCCGGMTAAVQRAVAHSGKEIPVTTVVISVDGQCV